jgi:hypothetical protein
MGKPPARPGHGKWSPNEFGQPETLSPVSNSFLEPAALAQGPPQRAIGDRLRESGDAKALRGMIAFERLYNALKCGLRLDKVA